MTLGIEKKKSILKIGALVFSISVLCIACSSDSSSETKYPYTYSYEANGCTTQAITSYSQVALCKNLLDNVLNNDCAHEQRNATYEAQNCAQALGIADN